MMASRGWMYVSQDLSGEDGDFSYTDMCAHYLEKVNMTQRKAGQL